MTVGRGYLGLTLFVLMGFPACAVGTRPLETPADTRVILTRDLEPAAVWRFVPIDMLPGGLDAELVELAPPPPTPGGGG